MSEYMLRGPEVARILKISESTAWNIIRGLNKELEAKGYLTLRGRIPIAYLFERFGGLEGVPMESPKSKSKKGDSK